MLVERFRNSFLYKILAIAIGICLITVSLVASSLLYVHYTDVKQEILVQTHSQVRVLADNIAAALFFEQPDAITEQIQSLESNPQYLESSVFRFDDIDKKLSLFLTHKNKRVENKISFQVSTPMAEGEYFSPDHLTVVKNIYLEGTLLGQLAMVFSLERLQHSQQRLVAIAIIIVTLALTITIIIYRAALGMIMTPIARLSETTRKVKETNNFSLRAEVYSQDEIGRLTSSFNDMLAELERYDHLRQEKEKEIINLNEGLEKMVAERTQQLKDSNDNLVKTLDELREAQDFLVQNEKMASLGSLVAGIAHEINTPIGIGVTAASHLENQFHEIIRLYESQDLSEEDFEDFIEKTRESLRIILTNLDRAAKLVRSFKMVSVDQSSEESRAFNLYEYTQEVLTSLRPKLKRTRHSITLNIDPAINLVSFPGAFSQIITNLVVNSLTHAFENKEYGHMEFNAIIEGNLLKFNYSDDGCGIPNQLVDRVFEPFVTSKRGKGGSGLGTHIMYNIVTQLLHGSIYCESMKDKGTTFYISIPLENNEACRFVDHLGDHLATG